MHGDHWPAVAEYVGTHSVLECITHFLQLPIEDDFLDELEKRAAQPPGQVHGGAEEQQLEGQEADIGEVPMCGTADDPGNPVMSLVGG